MKQQQDKLEICKQTRMFAADSLYKVLKKLLASHKPISEVRLRDEWLTEMRKNKNIFPDGWYTPPPFGISVLFGDDKHLERINYKSLREKDKWPRNNVFLNTNSGIAFFYISPVDKESGIIGDFAITLYFGKDKTIQNHFLKSFTINKEVFINMTIGMSLNDINQLTYKLLQKNGVSSDLLSPTDPTGTNYGHTIPASYENWNSEEIKALQNGSKDWETALTMISKKRKFVNAQEPLKIKPGMAVTIESRPEVLDNPKIPMTLFHMIAIFKEDGSKELLTGFDNLFTLSGMDYMIEPVKKQKISYKESGVDYESLDPAKTLAQKAGQQTAKHLTNYGFNELSDTRGESAFIWKQKNIYMASVTESLGTKNLVADAMREITGKTYYDAIGYDTVASALNDLTSVGAKPLTVFAFWAVGKSSWLDDLDRTTDLVNGWKQACDDAEATWGGGETPSYNDIVRPEVVALGGSVVGIIKTKKRLLLDKKIKVGDRILFLKSSGINANGISLSRAVAKKLPNGYATKLKTGEMYGEAILAKTHIYAKLIQDLLDANIDLHYISNITGHGLRKVMRGRGNFTYVVEKVFEPQELFTLIQHHAGMSDYEIYGTYNMGQDYALFLPEKDIKKAQQIVKKNNFESLNAGYVTKGERQVIIEPKNITFTGDRLQVRT
ncbi:MAG: AIR synthase related protein [Patescibacteria group bacterium]